MRPDYRLLLGPTAAGLFGLGVAALPLMIYGYSQIHQTVSEIGEVGSPARVAFSLMLAVVALCILIFAAALRDRSVKAGYSPWAAYLTACMAISAGGIAVFAYPSPLHNYFGLSELVGYQAPLVLAFSWRRDPAAKAVVMVSWVMAVFMWCSIALNLATLDRGGALWAFEHPFYGLVQRSLFTVWFGWCAIIGVILFRDTRRLESKGELLKNGDATRPHHHMA